MYPTHPRPSPRLRPIATALLLRGALLMLATGAGCGSTPRAAPGGATSGGAAGARDVRPLGPGVDELELAFVTAQGEGGGAVHRFTREGCAARQGAGWTGAAMASDTTVGCVGEDDVAAVAEAFDRAEALPATGGEARRVDCTEVALVSDTWLRGRRADGTRATVAACASDRAMAAFLELEPTHRRGVGMVPPVEPGGSRWMLDWQGASGDGAVPTRARGGAEVSSSGEWWCFESEERPDGVPPSASSPAPVPAGAARARVRTLVRELEALAPPSVLHGACNARADGLAVRRNVSDAAACVRDRDVVERVLAAWRLAAPELAPVCAALGAAR